MDGTHAAVALLVLWTTVLAMGLTFGRDREYGYADGCRDGSRGHSQVVTVEGKRKCVPHQQAIEMRK